MTQEAIIIIGLAVKDHAHVRVESGKRDCASCGTEVWVSLAGMAEMEDRPGSKVLCMTCGVRSIENDPEPKVMPPTPAQVAEITRAMTGRGGVDN